MSEAGPSPIELVHQTRDALRKIRRAVVDGLIGTDQMQEYSTELLDRFAKALLTLKRPRLLKEEDQQNVGSHIDNLKEYIDNLLAELKVEALNVVGNPIDEDRFNYLVSVTTSRSFIKLLQLREEGDQEIVALLSTGALFLALATYIFELPVTYAAVSGDYEAVHIPPIDAPHTLVIDDVTGQQVRRVAHTLTDQQKVVRTTDFTGQAK